MSYIDSPEVAGRVAYRSEMPDPEVAAGGFYVPVTIVGDVTPADRLAQEELFGPVLSVMRAKDFDHALELAVSTPFALTGGVFSSKPGEPGQGRPPLPGRQSLPEPSDNRSRGRPATVRRLRPLRRGNEGRWPRLSDPFHESKSRHGKVPGGYLT